MEDNSQDVRMGRSPAGTLGWHYPGEPAHDSVFAADTGLFDDGFPGNTVATFHGAVAECAAVAAHWGVSPGEEPSDGIPSVGMLLARPEASRRAVYLPPGSPGSRNPVPAAFVAAARLELRYPPSNSVTHLYASGKGGGGWFAAEDYVTVDFVTKNGGTPAVWERPGLPDDVTVPEAAQICRTYARAALSALAGGYDLALPYLQSAVMYATRAFPPECGA